MFWFYVGIAQIALDPPPLSNGQMWKKVPQTILASLYIHPLLMGNAHMASLTTDINTKVKNVNTVFGDRNCHPGAGLPHHVISYYEFMMIVISTVELSVETVLF